MKRTRDAVLVVLAIAIIPAIVWFLSLWTDRNLEFWFTYFKGEQVDVPMWISVVTTMVLNGIILIGNILGELFRLIV
jgi:hypothetical protein